MRSGFAIGIENRDLVSAYPISERSIYSKTDLPVSVAVELSADGVLVAIDDFRISIAPILTAIGVTRSDVTMQNVSTCRDKSQRKPA